MTSSSIDFEKFIIKSRSMPDPTLSDIDFKNKMAWVWTTLNSTLKSFALAINREFMIQLTEFISVENVPTQPKIILTDKDEKKQIASIMKLLKKKGIKFKKYFLPKLFLFIKSSHQKSVC